MSAYLFRIRYLSSDVCSAVLPRSEVAPAGYHLLAAPDRRHVFPFGRAPLTVRSSKETERTTEGLPVSLFERIRKWFGMSLSAEPADDVYAAEDRADSVDRSLSGADLLSAESFVRHLDRKSTRLNSSH